MPRSCAAGSGLQGRGRVGTSVLLAQNSPKYLCIPERAAALETENTTKQPQRQQKDKQIQEFVPPTRQGDRKGGEFMLTINPLQQLYKWMQFLIRTKRGFGNLSARSCGG